MHKKIVLTGAVLGVLCIGLLTAHSAFAATTSTDQTPISLAQKIADKFGLNKADVQAVFDQERQDRQAQHEKNYEARLTQDVTDGKLTDAQKQLILNKHKELEANMVNELQNIKSLTAEERKAARQKRMADLQNWAKENGVDVKYLRMMGGRGRPGMKMK